MADLSVQPKKKTNPFSWILLVAGLIALVWFLTRNLNANRAAPTGSASTTLSSVPLGSGDSSIKKRDEKE